MKCIDFQIDSWGADLQVERTTRDRRKQGGSGPSARSDLVKQCSESELLKGSLAYAIKRAQLRADAALVKYLDYAISPARLGALTTIAANPGISQAELSAHLNIAGPSVVKLVNELEKRDLVNRKPGANKRSYALHLSSNGTKQLRRYTENVKAFESELSATFTRTELRQLFSLLARVAPDEL